MQRNGAKRSESHSPKRCDQDKPRKRDSLNHDEPPGSWIAHLSIGLLILLAILSIAQFDQLRQIRAELSLVDGIDSSLNTNVQDVSIGDLAPRVWIIGTRMEVGYLQHVIDVFKRVGYQVVNGSAGQEWDVLWSHDYPFGHLITHTLQPHQRINHFPGCGFITNKVSLATSDLLHVPKAFHIPKQTQQFIEYTKQHPHKKWVQKSNAHRGIRVQRIEHVDLNGTGTFMQEFIHNPLLIDGRKFDIGMYVSVTSLNPLRVYLYDGEALLRFCAKDYHPFNATELNSYVVGDDYTPIWQMPSLEKYYKDAGFNMKESLNLYLTSIGKDPQKIWRQIEESISSVLIAKERQMYGMMDAMHLNQRHFFEMMRFDFLVDDELNVHLLEANMSPNLSSLHFKPNQALYEHVIMNVLSLNRLLMFEATTTWPQWDESLYNHRLAANELSVRPDICASNDCLLSCQRPQCHICTFCFDPDTRLQLKDAILEHSNRFRQRRLLPNVRNVSMNSQFGVNTLHLQWFQGKCLLDSTWC